MNYGKNLTGEKKGTFSSLDVTGQLNIDDNGSFLSSGNIVSSGSITALHGAYEDLYAKKFNCSNASFSYVEFDEHWTGIGTVDNLSILNACFTTLNDVSKTTFSYIANLKSDAQAQIDNVSALAHGTQNSLDTLAGTVGTLSTDLSSVSTTAHYAYSNTNDLTGVVANVSQNLCTTTISLNNFIQLINTKNASINASIQSDENKITALNSSLQNISTTFWSDHTTVGTLSSSMLSGFAWIKNVSLEATPYQ